MRMEASFATSADGTRIAWSRHGSGPPLVRVGTWLTHLDFDWSSPLWRHWLDALGQRFTVVRYDDRGSGLSDRNPEEYSLGAWRADLEAVVEAARLRSFTLLGMSQGGAVAIDFAHAHPQRITNLVLYGAYAQGATARSTTAADIEERALREQLIKVGWGRADPVFRRVFTSSFIPGASEAQLRWFDDLQRRSMSPDAAEDGIGPAPPHLDQLFAQGSLLDVLSGRAACGGPLGVGPVQDQVGDALRMRVRKIDGDGPSLGHTEQGEAAQPRRFDHGLEVSTPRAKRVLLGVAIGEAAAAVVIPNDREPLAERVQPMAPERARPVEVEMRKPGPDPHQRRTTTVSRPRDTSPVGRRRKGRLHPHQVSVAASSALCVSVRQGVRQAGPNDGAVSQDASLAAEAVSRPLVWDEDEETAIQSPHGGHQDRPGGGPTVAPKHGVNRQHFDLTLTNDDSALEVHRLVALGPTPLGGASWPIQTATGLASGHADHPRRRSPRRSGTSDHATTPNFDGRVYLGEGAIHLTAPAVASFDAA